MGIMTFFFGSRWWPAVLSLLKAKHEGKKIKIKGTYGKYGKEVNKLNLDFYTH